MGDNAKRLLRAVRKHALATQHSMMVVAAMCFGVIAPCELCGHVGERRFVEGVRSYVVYECRCGASWQKRATKFDRQAMEAEDAGRARTNRANLARRRLAPAPRVR